MASSEKRDNGMDEKGNILFRLKFITKSCRSENIGDRFYLPGGNRYQSLSPEDQFARTAFSLYHKAFIEQICIEFKDYKWDGSQKEKCSEIKSEQIEVPPDFISLPKDTQAAGIIERGGILNPFSTSGGAGRGQDYGSYPCLLPGTDLC